MTRSPLRLARTAGRTAARTLAITLTTALLTVVGCGGGGSTPPNVYLTSTLGSAASGAGAGMCNINQPGAPFVTYGTGPGSTINNGGSYLGSTVQVSCTVHSTGGETFLVEAAVSDVALGGITFTTTVTYDASNAGAAQPVSVASFTKPNSGSWDTSETGASPCTFALTTNAAPPITSGRVWGTLTCPGIVDPSTGSLCAATAEVVLQDCTQ